MKQRRKTPPLSPCAGEGTRTHTPKHQILSLACLPISTRPQNLPARGWDDVHKSSHEAQALGSCLRLKAERIANILTKSKSANS